MNISFGLLVGMALASMLGSCESSTSNSFSSTSLTGVELVLEYQLEGRWSASLVNRGETSIDVVLPGDGSDRGWRTPILRWSVTTEMGVVDLSRGGGCGNINSLQADEVVHLRSGATVSLDRYGLFPPNLPARGIVSVSLEYENIPDLQWSGVPLGVHNREAMSRIRASQALHLVSNVVRLEIPKGYEFELQEPSEDR